MHRRDALLAILGTAEGRTFSPVQLQKAAFLVARNAPHIFDADSVFSFEPYDYGPFDRDVYSEATALEMQGLATVSRTARYSEYAASDAGVAAARQKLVELPEATRKYIEEVVAWVRTVGFATLVKSIYAQYPEMRENSIFQG